MIGEPAQWSTEPGMCRSSSTMLPPLVPPAVSGAAARPPSSFFVPPPAAQRPAPISSPAQELASQPFDTGNPAQILAEESPIREDPQAPLHSTLPQENATEQPADQSRPREGRRSSGFGQWLNNGASALESHAGAPPPEAPAGPGGQPGGWQGSQAYGQASSQQPWDFHTSQPPARQEPLSGDIFTAYASLAEPAQQTSVPSPGQGTRGQDVGLSAMPQPNLPAGTGTRVIDSEEMKEIEL